MSFPPIQVEVSHPLSQAAAWDRLLSLRDKERPTFGAVQFKILKAELDNEAFKLTTKVSVTVLARTFTHTLTFTAEPGRVRCVSDAPDEFGEGLEMRAEAQFIKQMLQEALK